MPIGYYTSQWFSNFYLEQLDHFIKQDLKVKFYLRYVDDMLIFGNNKRKLHRIKKQIEEYLRNNLQLELKDNWQLFPIDKRAVDFIGYRISRTNIKLRNRTLKLLKRRIRKLDKGKNNINNSRSLISLFGWLKHTKKRLRPELQRKIEYTKKYISNYDKRMVAV